MKPPTAAALPKSVTEYNPARTCYLCGEKRHKSPQCPQRGKGPSSGTASGPKKPAAPVRTVCEHSATNIVPGKVGGRDTTIVLDTGARISVVPEELVEEDAFCDKTVMLLDANGGEVRRRIARVWLHVGGVSTHQYVAVAPSSTLRGHVLVAMDLKKWEDLQLLTDYGQGKLDVRATQTRADVESERIERLAEELTLAIENPVCRVPAGLDGVSPEVEHTGALVDQSPGVELGSPGGSKTPVLVHKTPMVDSWCIRLPWGSSNAYASRSGAECLFISCNGEECM